MLQSEQASSRPVSGTSTLQFQDDKDKEFPERTGQFAFGFPGAPYAAISVSRGRHRTSTKRQPGILVRRLALPILAVQDRDPLHAKSVTLDRNICRMFLQAGRLHTQFLNFESKNCFDLDSWTLPSMELE
jgi:hypothetical protein